MTHPLESYLQEEARLALELSSNSDKKLRA